MKIGIGYDVHKLVSGRKLILGGVEIPHEKGLLGHSDADVLLHAIMDSILGALNIGSIGDLFPDTSSEYENVSSLLLLEKVYWEMEKRDFTIANIDSVIIAEKPKMQPYISKMKSRIAKALNTSPENVSVKATTTEKLGFAGRKEGIAAKAVVLLKTK
jgi:2-C-methyl-D-erythritol 2,4-cyclodiphosphate synthase